jgi:hypothetical protein
VWRSLLQRTELLQERHKRMVIIGEMMEAVSTFETSVNFYWITLRTIPEDSHIHNQKILKHESPYSLFLHVQVAC